MDLVKKKYNIIPTKMKGNISSKILFFFLVIAIISYMLIRIAQYDLIPIIVNQPTSLAGISKSTASLFSFNINPANISLSLLYWFMIIVSLGMLPLLSPRLLLIAVPWIFYTFFITINFTIGFGNQDILSDSDQLIGDYRNNQEKKQNLT